MTRWQVDKSDGHNGGIRRRRNWTKAAKGRVVMAMLAPGANVSKIAREHEISRQHLYLWRKSALEGRLPLPALPAEQVVPSITVTKASANQRSRAVEIDVGEFTVRIPPGADSQLVMNIVSALKSLA
jgi:transposase